MIEVYQCQKHGLSEGNACDVCKDRPRSDAWEEDMSHEAEAPSVISRPTVGGSRLGLTNSDPVNHPSHYQLFPGQEAIDVIEATLTPEEFAGYCKGNALKYRLRAGEKGDTQQDIDKSNWYRDRLRSLFVNRPNSERGAA